MNQDYEQLLQLLEKEDLSKDDVYQKLIAKEEKVLNTINRISESVYKQNIDRSIFYNMTLVQITVLVVNTWKRMFDDLMQVKKPIDFIHTFWKNDRKIYTGISLVLLSIMLFFVC